MPTQKEKAEQFQALHVKGNPLIIFNIWDAGSAQAVAVSGAKAIATGSWAVAAANGYGDGEKLPFDWALANLERIVQSVDLPVSLDLEGGYTTDPTELKANLEKVIAAGAIGINFEDRIVAGEGLHSIEAQSARIAALRAVAAAAGIPFFINARTDVFLSTYPAKHNETQLEEALQRTQAYAAAGASGLFAPGLRDPGLIERLCANSPLPVNIMVLPDTPSAKEMADLGVARISHGAGPYRHMQAALNEAARQAFAELA